MHTHTHTHTHIHTHKKDGYVTWLNAEDLSVFYSKRLAETHIVSLSYAPSLANFVAVDAGNITNLSYNNVQMFYYMQIC